MYSKLLHQLFDIIVFMNGYASAVILLSLIYGFGTVMSRAVYLNTESAVRSNFIFKYGFANSDVSTNTKLRHQLFDLTNCLSKACTSDVMLRVRNYCVSCFILLFLYRIVYSSLPWYLPGYNNKQNILNKIK